MSNEYYMRGDAIQPFTLADARQLVAEFTKLEQAFDKLPAQELLNSTSYIGLFGNYSTNFNDAIAKYSVDEIFICDESGQMIIYVRTNTPPGYEAIPAQPFALQDWLETTAAAIIATAQGHKEGAQAAQAGAEDSQAAAITAQGLAQTAATDAQAAANLSADYGDMPVYRTWALLNAATAAANDMATVLTDTGTHTDPVVGGSASNSGIFSYSASPAGWERIGDTQAANAAYAAAASAASAAGVEALRTSFGVSETVGSAAPITPTSIVSASADVWDKAFSTTKTVQKFWYNASSAGTVTMIVYSRSGSTFTPVASQVLTVAAGLNTFVNGVGGFTNFTLAAGNYVGVYHNNKGGRTTNAAYGTGFWSGAGTGAWADTALSTTIRIEAGFEVFEQTLTAVSLTAEQAARTAGDVSVDRLVRQRDRLARVIVPFGDSRAAQETTTAPVASMNVRGVLEWAAIRSGQRIICDPAQNYGGSGERTDQFLARIATVKRCTAPNVFLPGWANDTAQNVASTTTQANILAIVQGLRDSGKTVFVADDYPASTYTGPQMVQHVLTRDYVRSLHNPAGGVYVVRTWDTIATAADGTTPKTDALADGLHPAPYGGWLQAGALVTAAQAAFLDSDIAGSQAANLVANPGMTGTSGGLPAGGATGQVASGWSGTGPSVTGSGTIAYAKVTSGGREWQQISVGGVWSSAPGIIGMSQDIALASFAAGDVIDLICRVEVDAASTNLRNVAAAVWLTSGGVAGISGNETPAQFYPTDAWSGIFHARFVWPSGATRITPILYFAFQAASASAVVRFSDCQVRKIT